MRFRRNRRLYKVMRGFRIGMKLLFLRISKMVIREMKCRKIIDMFICLMLKGLCIKNMCFMILLCKFVRSRKLWVGFNMNRVGIYR